jgi:hypothetical protein
MEQLLKEIDELLKSRTRASRRAASVKLNSVASIASTLAITVYFVAELLPSRSGRGVTISVQRHGSLASW